MKLKPYLDIVKLVWPLALGMINTAVMQFADRAYLASYSQEALGAVLPAGMLMWIFGGFFQSVIGYSSVFVAQFYGEGEPSRCRETYRCALLLAVVAGLMSLPLRVFGDGILALTTADAALLDDKRAYYDILILGAVFVYGQMAAASYFTGLGRTRIVFWVNLLGNLLNIALDPLLIFGCDWGRCRSGRWASRVRPARRSPRWRCRWRSCCSRRSGRSAACRRRRRAGRTSSGGSCASASPRGSTRSST